MVCFGEYERKCRKDGKISIPAKWLDEDTKELYFVWCRDTVQEAEYLRFFYELDELERFKEENEADCCEILQSKIQKVSVIDKEVRLPKIFCEKGMKSEQTFTCVGVVRGFEIWYTEDFSEIKDQCDDILESFEQMLSI